MAMTEKLFVEPSPGHISHCATSAALQTNKKLRDQTAWMSEIIAPTVAAMVNAHEKWRADTEASHTPFKAAFDTELPMYHYLVQRPETYKLFGRVIETLARSPRSDLKHLVKGFDWESLGNGLVVDVSSQ